MEAVELTNAQVLAAVIAVAQAAALKRSVGQFEYSCGDLSRGN